jgi:hypothetical protein
LERPLKSNDFDRQVKLAAEQLRHNGPPAEIPNLKAEQLAARAYLEQMRLLRHMLSTPTAEYMPADPIFRRRDPSREALQATARHHDIRLSVGKAVGFYLEARRDSLAPKSLVESGERRRH